MKSDILLGLKEIVKVRIVDYCIADRPFIHADRVLGFNVFIYIVSGYMKIWEEGAEYVVGEKNVFFLKKGLHHYGKAEIPQGTTWYYIHFHGGQDTENSRIFNEYSPLAVSGEFTEEDYDQYIRLPKLMKVDNPKLIERKLDALTQLCKSSNDLRMAYLSYGAMELFFDIFNQERSRLEQDRADIITRRLILYLESNASRELTSHEISSHICMNYNYVSGLFKKKTGMSIMEYHEKVRMSEAAALLRGSNLNISEVSDRLGFRDPLYFSRVFKKVMGYSPSEYMKQAYFRG
jgi:AraC family transcriptional regulator of arabinose operon